MAFWRSGARRTAALCGSLLLAGGLSCGGEEAAAPQPFVPPAAPAGPAEAGAANRAPQVEDVRLEPGDPLPGAPVQAVVRASDPDGHTVRLRYRWTLNGRDLGEVGARVAPRDAAKDDVLEVEVIASDGRLDSEPYRDSVQYANRPPEIWGVALEAPDVLAPGEDLVASPSGHDPDQDEISFHYTWTVNGDEVDTEGATLQTASLRRGDRIQVTVVASDGDAESEPKRSREVTLGNSPPRILSEPSWDREDGVFRYTVEAEDPEDRTLRYRLVKAPPSMRIDSVLGRIEWKPGPDDAGAHDIEVEVDDLHGGTTLQKFQLTVNVEEPEAPAAAQGAASPAAAPAPDL